MQKETQPTLAQKEAAHHGEAAFPIKKYITTLHPSYTTVTTHWHDEAELTLITQGEAIYQIRLADYPVQNGDLLFVPPRILHAIQFQDSSKHFEQNAVFSLNDGITSAFSTNGSSNFLSVPSESFCSETYVFHMNFLGANGTDLCATRYLIPLMKEELVLPCYIPPSHPAYPELISLFHEINRLFADMPTGYELALKSALLQVICVLLPYAVSDEASSPSTASASQKLKGILDYINSNYQKDFTISELAARCYFSEAYFMRFFKKHMKMTVITYINNLRLEKALALFEAGETSILEVSLEAGFHNLSYFHKLFKKKYQMTPKEFLDNIYLRQDSISD